MGNEIVTNEMTLYQKMTDAFHKVQPVESWSAKAAEFKTLKGLIAKLEKMDDPEKRAMQILRFFFKKRKSGDSFWRDTPFTPRGLSSRWDRILTELDRKEQNGDAAVIDEVIDPNALDVLKSFEVVYSREYEPGMKKQMLKKIGGKARKYLVALHDEICASFRATSTRPLPDPAEVQTAMVILGNPEMYLDRKPALPEPKEQDENHEYRAAWEHILDILCHGGHLGTGDKEINHEQRQQARGRVMRGTATEHEKIWIEGIDNGRKM